jgi:CRISPR-associated protein (Cas_Cas02710)
MGVYVATLGRNPTVVLLGYFTALKYARDTLGSDQVLNQVYLLPETLQVKDSNETQRLCNAFSQVGLLSVRVLDVPSGFPETEAALKKLSLESDLPVFLNYTGGRKYLSLGALKYASENGWYGFSLNPYDRLGFSALFQCAPKDVKLERFAVQPLPLGVLLDLNGIEVLSLPKEEHVIWVKIENQQYAVVQDRERVFVCDPTPIPSADKKPEFVRRQNHARQIGDLLAVPVYCPLEEADVKDYSTYISALEKENGVVFDSNFDNTIARFRQRQHLESDLESHSPKPPLDFGKVLIVLISDQPMNAYAPILAHQPNQVYLLTTPEKSRVAQNIRQALASADRDIQVCSWLDSSNPATTADLVERILVLCEGQKVILNASGLTTPMSASAFLVALKNPHVDIEYLDWGNILKLSGAKIIVDWRDKSQTPLRQMETVFSLHGFDSVHTFNPMNQ